MKKQTLPPKKVDDIRNLKILIVDDNPNVINSLHYELVEDYGFNHIEFVKNGAEAEAIMHHQTFAIISCDYYLNSIERMDGVGLLKYLIPKQKDVKKIIYTKSEDSEIAEVQTECDKLNIEIIRKTEDHGNLKRVIESYYHAQLGLPLQPKYAFMNEKELLLVMSEDLLKDLSSMENDEDKVYLSTENPITIKELIGHIKKMSPLGKEYLGIWFDGQRKTMSYYESIIKSNLNI